MDAPVKQHVDQSNIDTRPYRRNARQFPRREGVDGSPRRGLEQSTTELPVEIDSSRSAKARQQAPPPDFRPIDIIGHRPTRPSRLLQGQAGFTHESRVEIGVGKNELHLVTAAGMPVETMSRPGHASRRSGSRETIG